MARSAAPMCCHTLLVAELVYIDETGSVGRAARRQPLLTLVAVVVDEATVQPLANGMDSLAMKHLGWVPADFEFHGHEVWNATGYWAGKTPPELLAAFEGVIGLLDALSISVVHSTINKPALNAKYQGAADDNAYKLALQFLLEKLDRWKTNQVLRVLIADEAKQEQLRAIKLVKDMQRWAAGVVPGRQLVSIIDSMHFVDSAHSPGVQLADMVAFAIHRARLNAQQHPDVTSAVARMREAITLRTPTWRDAWP